MKYTLAAVFICLPVAAFAGKAEGDACATGLSGPSKKIYDAVAPEATSASDLRGLVKSKVRKMVFAGEIKRSTAKASAEAAGPCLKKLKD